MNPLAALLMSIADELKLIEKVEVRSGELTPYQGYIVIKILETAPAPMRVLAERLGIAKSTMTRNIDKLEAAGLVKRVKSGEDGRVAYVDLTEKGHLAAQKIKKDWNNYFFLVEQQLDDEELMKVLEGLEIMLRALRKVSERESIY